MFCAKCGKHVTKRPRGDLGVERVLGDRMEQKKR